MKQNFVKIESKALRKVLINTVNFQSSCKGNLPNFIAFFIAWAKVNDIQQILTFPSQFSVNLLDFYRINQNIM